jgi:hypothetical protein
MSLRWIDDDVLAITDAAAVVLTPTKINRPGSSFANVVRIYNYGSDSVFYGFGGNQNPPVPPAPAAHKGVEIPSGQTIDISEYDNLQLLQFICASGESATLYIIYGTQ